MIHILFEGRAVCGAGSPSDWPLDYWLAYNVRTDKLGGTHIDRARCALCLFRARERWPEVWGEAVISGAMRESIEGGLINWDRDRLIGEEQD